MKQKRVVADPGRLEVLFISAGKMKEKKERKKQDPKPYRNFTDPEREHWFEQSADLQTLPETTYLMRMRGWGLNPIL